MYDTITSYLIRNFFLVLHSHAVFFKKTFIKKMIKEFHNDFGSEFPLHYHTVYDPIKCLNLHVLKGQLTKINCLIVCSVDRG